MIYSATDFLKVELGIGFIQMEQTKLALHRSKFFFPRSLSCCSSLQGIELGAYVTKLWMYNKCLHKRVDETKLRVPIDSRIVQDREIHKRKWDFIQHNRLRVCSRFDSRRIEALHARTSAAMALERRRMRVGPRSRVSRILGFATCQAVSWTIFTVEEKIVCPLPSATSSSDTWT
jgi:hypothetical protein